MFDIGVEIDEFILTFIQRLRRDERCKAKPSLRQGTALFQLLLSRYARQREISVNDLISAAVLTTYYEDQNIAKEIAKELVVSRVNEKIVEGKGPRTNNSYEKLLTIKNIAGKYMEDEEVLDEMLKRPYSEFEDMDGLIDLIFNAKKDNLSPAEIEFLSQRGRLEDYYDQIEDKKLQTYADSLMENFKSMENKIEEIFKTNPNDISQLIETLNELTDSSREVKNAFEKLVSNLENFEDYQKMIERSSLFTSPTSEQLKSIPEKNLSEILQQAQEIDQKFGENLTGQIFREFTERGHEFNGTEISQGYNQDKSWNKALQNMVDRLKKKASNDQIKSAIKRISQNSSSNSDPNFRDRMNSAIQNLSDELISRSGSAEEFIETMEHIQAENFPYDKDQANKQGESLNVPPDSLDKLLESKEKNLEEMIGTNLDSYSEFLQYLKDYPPGGKERRGMVEQGIKLGNSSLLGALGSVRMDETANMVADHGNSKITDHFLQGLSQGSGENLLKEWYNSRDNISSKIRYKIGAMIQDFVKNMAILNAKQYFGYIKSGLLLETSRFRPYRVGDDIDMVSIDETIAHLIDQGKPLEQVTNADIISHNERGQSLKLIVIIDKSGSMEGKKFAISTLAASTLLYLLKPDEIAIITFDDNTFPIKKLGEKTDFDFLTDTLIHLKAGGGTRFQRTLEYIRSIFDENGTDQKFLVCIFSDFAFFDSQSELKAELVPLQKFSPQILEFYTETPDKKNIDLFKRFLPLQEIYIPSVAQLPQILAQVLRQFT